MILLLTNIIWVIYTMLEGLREGFYWHHKSNTKMEYNFEIHPVFSFQRGIVLSLIGFLLFPIFGWISILFVVCMMLIFSFFHNGIYYVVRNKIDNRVYKLGWFDQSTTSTAKMTKIMTYKNRTILMIVGVLVQIITIYIINYK